MTITMGWDDDEQQVYLMRAVGDWTLDDYYSSFRQATEAMNAVDHPIALIMDLSESSAPPARFLSTGRFAQQHSSPNIKRSVMVGMPSLSRALMDVMMRLFPSISQRLRIFETLEEARDFVYSRDQA